MKISYNRVRAHYQLTDYTPGMGHRVIDSDTDLTALMHRHGMLEEEPETPSDPFVEDGELDLDSLFD